MVGSRSRMSAPPGPARASGTPVSRHIARPRRTDVLLEEDADSGQVGELGPQASPRRRYHHDLLGDVLVGKQHRRTRSFTHTASTSHEDINLTPAGKKARLRRSLAGPVVHEMTVETRATIVSEVAEDCIVKLLKPNKTRVHRPGDFEEECRLAYQSLQSESSNGVCLRQY